MPGRMYLGIFKTVLSTVLVEYGRLGGGSHSLAELIGAAIALQMLFGLPIMFGSVLTAVICTVMLLTNSYALLE